MVVEFPKDEWTNLSSTVISKIGKNITYKKGHPLNTIKRRIESYWKNLNQENFSVKDDLSPFVTTYQNFDSLLFPLDHPGRRKTDTYYINKGNVLRTHMTYSKLPLDFF
jgi:phenylalanyl-tRNA synthetase alpha chain